MTKSFAESLIDAYEGDDIARKKWVDSDTKDVIFVKISKNGKPKLKLRFNDGSTANWSPRQKDIFAGDWYSVRSYKNLN